MAGTLGVSALGASEGAGAVGGVGAVGGSGAETWGRGVGTAVESDADDEGAATYWINLLAHESSVGSDRQCDSCTFVGPHSL